MINQIKAQLIDSARPIADWIAHRGCDFAVDLIGALLILLIGALLIKLLSKVLANTLEKKVGDKALLVKFAVSVVVKACWAVLLVVVLDKLGVAVGPLVAGLGVTGFILGFAFQESLGSLAAGLMIALNQPFKVGDYVSVAGHEGVIKHLDMMAVTLSTADNRKITIPNKQAWGSPIVNYSALELRRVDIAIGIAYGSDINKAKELARSTMAALPQVVRDPAPMSEVVSFDDSEVALTCRCWVKNADYWAAFFAGNQAVFEAFEKNGIEIPYPQIDVHMAK